MGRGRSTMERLMSLGVAEAHLLDTQYRMHPQISAFPSRVFYDGALCDSSTVLLRPG